MAESRETEEVTDVVFRRFRKEKTVIALFPGLPGTTDVSTCDSYMRVGQHGSATVWLTNCTALAKETDPDVIELKKELERIGYKLRVVKKITQKHWDQRRQFFKDREAKSKPKTELKTVLSRDGKLVGKVVGYRRCQMEGCTGKCVGVRWEDKSLTWVCTKGLTYLTEEKAQLSSPT